MIILPSARFYLKVTVTVRFPVIVTVQGFVVPGESQPTQLANCDVPIGLAVSVTTVPVMNWARQGVGLEQLRPMGRLVTVPEPLPKKVSVRAGDEPPPPPELPKQVTFPVMNPVTAAPEEEMPPALVFVVTVADMSEAPHDAPVTVTTPAESTVIICGVFDVHVT